MQNADFEWFIANYVKLYKKFGSAYLAIKNKTVLGTYESYAEGVCATQKTEELGTFIIQKCGKDESSYTNYISSTMFHN